MLFWLRQNLVFHQGPTTPTPSCAVDPWAERRSSPRNTRRTFAVETPSTTMGPTSAWETLLASKSAQCPLGRAQTGRPSPGQQVCLLLTIARGHEAAQLRAGSLTLSASDIHRPTFSAICEHLWFHQTTWTLVFSAVYTRGVQTFFKGCHI